MKLLDVLKMMPVDTLYRVQIGDYQFNATEDELKSSGYLAREVDELTYERQAITGKAVLLPLCKIRL